MLADQECTTKDMRQRAMTCFCNANNDPCLSASIHKTCIIVNPNALERAFWTTFYELLLPVHGCHSDYRILPVFSPYQVLQPARSVQCIFSNRLNARLLC